MIPITITDVRAVPGDSAFLIDDGKTAVLCDSGFGFTATAVLDNIKKLLGNRPLDYILLTHSHYDHVLGVPCLLAAYPKATVIASAYAARVFSKASAKQTMLELDAKAAAFHGLPPAPPFSGDIRVDITVEDGDTVMCADLCFRAVALPGHTKCCVGFYLEENKLLIGVETLCVYFGKDTYLPFCLVGYRVTLDSFKKVKQLDIDQMLMPHYGVVEKEQVKSALAKAEAVTHNARQEIITMYMEGKTIQQMLAFFTERDYKDHVRPTYPIDAFLLNTEILIKLIIREYLEENTDRDQHQA